MRSPCCALLECRENGCKFDKILKQTAAEKSEGKRGNKFWDEIQGLRRDRNSWKTQKSVKISFGLYCTPARTKSRFISHERER